MATLDNIFFHGHTLSFSPTKPLTKPDNPSLLILKSDPPTNWVFKTRKRKRRTPVVVGAVSEDQEVAQPKLDDPEEAGMGLSVTGSKKSEAFWETEGEELDRLTTRAINAASVLGVGTLAVTRLFTIDHDYWHVSQINDIVY